MRRGETITFVQPALPHYRQAFFSKIYATDQTSGAMYYSPKGSAIIGPDDVAADWARSVGPVRMLPLGFMWQSRALAVPIRRGDIVVIWGNPRCLSNAVLILKARLLGARTVWWGHYWSATTRTWRLVLRLWLMRCTHAVLFYTDAEVDAYHARTGNRDPRPIMALNNGLDLAPIEAGRQPYDATDRDESALFIGRLTTKAHLNRMLTAMTDPRLAGLHLHVVGDGPEAATLRAMADNFGVATRITWHGATTDEARIAQIANRCRIFVYPGAVGLSLIHAMAYGLPSVVHSDRWRQMPEIAAFEANRTGRTFDPASSTDLADQIAALIKDYESLGAYAQRCMAVTAKSFNVDDMVVRFKALIAALPGPHS